MNALANQPRQRTRRSAPKRRRRRRHVVGVIERRDPIPPGVYWLDVLTPAIRKWDEWYPGPNKIKLLRRDETPYGLWVLFEVIEPVQRWPAEPDGLGLPTVAPKAEATRKADTVQRPPPEKFPSIFEAFTQSATTTGLIILAVLWALSKKR